MGKGRKKKYYSEKLNGLDHMGEAYTKKSLRKKFMISTGFISLTVESTDYVTEISDSQKAWNLLTT
jgi:hypothetical protein